MHCLFALLLLALPLAYAQNPSLAQLQTNDVHVLQYALLLERLEFAFYNQYQNQFNSSDFVAAGLTATDYNYFTLIRNHEEAHVNFLQLVVPDPGTCTYTFPVTNVSTYIQVAALLENTGVSAYDGAINRIYDKGFQTAAATIATVEARHASYLNSVNNRIPFPNVTDIPVLPVDINTAVFGPNGFAQCTLAAGFALPELFVVQPIANSSDNAQPTPQTLTANDILVLQYALFLEHFEAAFYNFVVSNFSGQFPPSVAANIQLIQQHENSHVTTLTNVINSLGGTAGPACVSYNFNSINSVAAVYATASVLENTGVYAYDGAVSAINDNGLKQAAATIATVEARHAAYLNVLANTTQGPVNGGGQNGAYDLAYNFSTIVSAVQGTGLLGDCTTAFTFVKPFQVLVVKPYNTVAPTNAPSTTNAGTTSGPTSAPTTPLPTARPTTTNAAGTTTAGTTTGAPTVRPPTPAPSSTTSGSSIVSASVAVALLVALAAF